MEATKKKKVLIYIPEFPGLTETFIEREVSKLLERGNLDICVYSLKEGKGVTSDLVKANTVYGRLAFVGMIGAALFGLFRLKRVFNSYKMIKNNPNRTFFETKYLLVKSVGYARLFAKHNPDIIYAHFMSESSTLCLIASEILGCEFAVAAHAKDILVSNSSKKSENAELVAQKVFRSKFVAICNRVAYERAVELASEKDRAKIHLLYHGVDFEKLLNYPEKARPEDLGENVPVIFTNGRFSEKKGHKYLIQAAKIIKDRGFSYRMYILGGPGDKFDETSSYINELGLSNEVKIVGDGLGVSFSEVVSYYRLSDVYVFPSIDLDDGNSDGISNSLIEASVFRVPIVTTDAGSTLEFLSQEQSALIVPQRNPHALADSIERILFNQDLAKRLSDTAHNKAREMFSIGKNIEAVEKLLL